MPSDYRLTHLHCYPRFPLRSLFVSQTTTKSKKQKHWPIKMTRNVRWKPWTKVRQRRGSICCCQFWSLASHKVALMNINNSYENKFVRKMESEQTLQVARSSKNSMFGVQYDRRVYNLVTIANWVLWVWIVSCMYCKIFSLYAE